MQSRAMKFIRSILSASCAGAILFGAAAASSAPGPSGRDKSLAGPIYNPATNSYFQLFEHPGAQTSHFYTWASANGRAATKVYKGKRGRLAVIRDPKDLEFVRANFSLPGATWIGLRFYCKYRKLLWSDGKMQGPKAQGMWHPKSWHRTAVRCASRGYMPIYLSGNDSAGIYWQASGPAKGFQTFLVEFPAPKTPKEASRNSGQTTKTGTQP